MPLFSAQSVSKLSTCHSDLQILFNEIIKTVDCTIVVGYRGEDDQNEAFKDGKSKLKWPHSKHNTMPSLAVDVAFYPIDWDDINKFYWFGGYVQGIADKLKSQGRITHDIRWGGAWHGLGNLNKSGLNDLDHFEIVE